jgi:hypothetical protein
MYLLREIFNYFRDETSKTKQQHSDHSLMAQKIKIKKQ